MAATVSGRLRDSVLGLGSLGVLIVGLTTISPDCRRYLVDAVQGQATMPDLPFQHAWREIAQLVPMGGSAVLPFAAAALVLFILMFRA